MTLLKQKETIKMNYIVKIVKVEKVQKPLNPTLGVLFRVRFEAGVEFGGTMTYDRKGL